MRAALIDSANIILAAIYVIYPGSNGQIKSLKKMNSRDLDAQFMFDALQRRIEGEQHCDMSTPCHFVTTLQRSSFEV